MSSKSWWIDLILVWNLWQWFHKMECGVTKHLIHQRPTNGIYFDQSLSNGQQKWGKYAGCELFKEFLLESGGLIWWRAKSSFGEQTPHLEGDVLIWRANPSFGESFLFGELKRYSVRWIGIQRVESVVCKEWCSGYGTGHVCLDRALTSRRPPSRSVTWWWRAQGAKHWFDTSFFIF